MLERERERLHIMYSVHIRACFLLEVHEKVKGELAS